MKDIEEERNRLLRTSSSQQQQIDKHKKLAEDARGKVDSLESQLSTMKKVNTIWQFISVKMVL